MRPNETFVGQPVRSLQTMLRVISEYDKSLPTVVPDGYYGPTTMNAVTAFQRKYGLGVTGVADEITWNAIVEAYEPALIHHGKAEPIEILLDAGEVLKAGDSDPYVYLAQSMLTQLSHDGITMDPPGHSGIMDDATVEAVTVFQNYAGLDPSGQIDRITWKHLVLHFTANVHHHKGRNNIEKLEYI